MEVSSPQPLGAENIPPVFFAAGTPGFEPIYVEDEEFPADLPVTYDWMLQPASQRTSRRVLGFIAVMIVAVMVAGSVFVVHNLSQSFPKALASPSSSAR